MVFLSSGTASEIHPHHDSFTPVDFLWFAENLARQRTPKSTFINYSDNFFFFLGGTLVNQLECLIQNENVKVNIIILKIDIIYYVVTQQIGMENKCYHSNEPGVVISNIFFCFFDKICLGERTKSTYSLNGRIPFPIGCSRVV